MTDKEKVDKAVGILKRAEMYVWANGRLKRDHPDEGEKLANEIHLDMKKFIEENE